MKTTEGLQDLVSRARSFVLYSVNSTKNDMYRLEEKWGSNLSQNIEDSDNWPLVY